MSVLKSVAMQFKYDICYNLSCGVFARAVGWAFLPWLVAHYGYNLCCCLESLFGANR